MKNIVALIISIMLMKIKNQTKEELAITSAYIERA